MNSLVEAVVTILAGITGVALLAVLVSKNSNTAGVIQAGASGYGNALSTALSPITGATTAANLAYPSSGSTGFYGQ